MRLSLGFSALLFAVSASSCLAQTHGWHTAFDAARTAAEPGAQPVLIHFHAWYCGPCQRMDRDVFADGQVQKALSGGLAAVKVDVTHEPDLAARCGATSVPRDVVMFPDGTIETLKIGYVSKTQYLNMLHDIAERGKRMTVPKPVEPSRDPSFAVNPPLDTEILLSDANRNDAATSDAARSDLNTVEESTTDAPTLDPPLIGLEGFCPVLLHDKREWAVGNDKITADHRGIRYLFASELNRDQFLKNPEIYAPQDLGCDAVVLTDTQRAVTGSIRFGAFFDDRLYLFQSPENREEFKKTPLKFARIRSALRIDQVEGRKFQ